MNAKRHLRQMLLNEVGKTGQAKLAAATANVVGPTAAHRLAAIYAERAGFGNLALGPAELSMGEGAEIVTEPAAAQALAGARQALREVWRALGREGDT